MEISSEEREGLPKALCKFAACWYTLSLLLRAALGEAAPKTSSLTHGSRTGFKQHHFFQLPGQQGVERLCGNQTTLQTKIN